MDQSDPNEITYMFEVEEDFKQNLDATTIELRAQPGNTCHLGGLSVGDRLALLTDGPGSYVSSWEVFDLDLMREVAAPFPAPDGEGDVAVLMGGSLGEVRVLALDKDLRTLGYGYGDGTVTDADICSQTDYMVEGGEQDDSRHAFVAIRRLSDLAVVEERVLTGGPRSGRRSLFSSRCFGYRVHSAGRKPGDPWSVFKIGKRNINLLLRVDTKPLLIAADRALIAAVTSSSGRATWGTPSTPFFGLVRRSCKPRPLPMAIGLR